LVGGTLNHDLITNNIQAAWRGRLRGTGCRPFGPTAGIATVGETVRDPDALVASAKIDDTAQLVENPRAVFEVLSPNFGRTNRVTKPREYQAVPSIRPYILLKYEGVALIHFARAAAADMLSATPLSAADMRHLPEIDATIPVAEFHEAVDLPDLP
jgi:Uma2 family endonuclease